MMPDQALIAQVNFSTLGLSASLGMSHEQTLKDCSIRELLIYLGGLPDPAAPPEPPTEEPPTGPMMYVV